MTYFVSSFRIQENTKRPVNRGEETGTMKGATAYGILKAYDDLNNGKSKKVKNPQFWNGKAAHRIVSIFLSHPYGSFKVKDKMD
jgi:UDP-N-acetylglucosamine 2-epimerase (non-hydrolysing)